jgi:hypothetical protein
MIEGFPVQDVVDAYTEIQFKILHINVGERRPVYWIL